MRRRREWGTMAAVVGNLCHNVSTDIVGLLWVVSYIGICRVASPLASELSARQPPSMPNRSLCRVCQFSTSWGNDALQRWCQRRWNRGRRRLFPQHANSRIYRWLYGCHRAPLPAFEHTTINTHNMQWDYVVKTRTSDNY